MIKDLQQYGIILDFDGTLVDSLPLWQEVDRDYLAKFSLEVPDDLMHSIEGMTFQECARYFKRRFGIQESTEEMIGQWNDLIFDKYSKLSFKADALRFLERLSEKPAIATSCQPHLVHAVLEHNAMQDRFAAVVTTEEIGFSKPHPAVFLKASEYLQKEASACLVFEDSLSGVQGAKAAGMKSVAVFEALNRRWEETKQMADYAIMSFDEMRDRV